MVTMTILLKTDRTNPYPAKLRGGPARHADLGRVFAWPCLRVTGPISNESMTELPVVARWIAVSRPLEFVLRCRHRSRASVRPV
jgi:hypothetical protein